MNSTPPPGDTPQRYAKVMTYGAWLLALGLLTAAFQHWLAGEANPNRHPHSARAEDAVLVELQRNRYGHYQASGSINGSSVQFMLDTGATDVAVPGPLARRLGLRQGPAYTTQTANGTATAYATRLEQVRLGDIELRDVRASIIPAMGGDEVLLGMSVLKHLDFSQQGDTLTLKQYTPRPATP
jgi:aspartyl protease family protein